jgi:hypothetical protein
MNKDPRLTPLSLSGSLLVPPDAFETVAEEEEGEVGSAVEVDERVDELGRVETVEFVFLSDDELGVVDSAVFWIAVLRRMVRATRRINAMATAKNRFVVFDK